MEISINANVRIVYTEPTVSLDMLRQLRKITGELNQRTAAIKAILEGTTQPTPAWDYARPLLAEESQMANQLVADAITAMTNATSVDASVLAFVSSVPGMIQAAVDAALAGGATAAELAPFTALSADLTAKTAAIVAAITPNTPVTPAQSKATKP